MYQRLSTNRKHCLQCYLIEFANRGKCTVCRGCWEGSRTSSASYRRRTSAPRLSRTRARLLDAIFIIHITVSRDIYVQGMLGGIKDKQRKLQEAHERTKTVTRTGEMKGIRERMQVRPPEPLADSSQCKAHPKGSRTWASQAAA